MEQSFNARLKQWLNKPFPFYESYWQKVYVPVGFTLLVMLGVIALSYSDNSEVFLSQIQGVIVYGVIIIFASLIVSLLLPELFPKWFDAAHWSVKKTILYFLLSVFVVGVFISVYAFRFDNPNGISFADIFLFVFKRSVVLSFFPILIIVFYAEKKLFKENHACALTLINQLQEQKPFVAKESKEIIFAKGTNDEFTLSEDKLCYIKAEGNYSHFVYQTLEGHKNILVRCNLKSIEHLPDLPEHIVRCHKSYIINMNKVLDVKGNAKGYFFFLKNHDEKIPVSRNFSKEWIHQVKQNRLQ